eukprot:scaffold180260_cov49-Prasinocladus_malaysianus.AAC.1
MSDHQQPSSGESGQSDDPELVSVCGIKSATGRECRQHTDPSVDAAPDVVLKRIKPSGSKASWRANSKQRHLQRVAELLARLPPPGGADLAAAYQPLVPAEHAVLATDEYWDDIWNNQVPEACDPACGGRLCGDKQGRGRTVVQRESIVELKPRAIKKRWQVATFALALRSLLGRWDEEECSAVPSGLTIVDFGSGSGNLILPLATLYPKCHFIGIDMKPRAVELLQQRVREAGLTNVEVSCSPYRASCPVNAMRLKLLDVFRDDA